MKRLVTKDMPKHLIGHGCQNAFIMFDVTKDIAEDISFLYHAHQQLVKCSKDDALILVKKDNQDKKIVYEMIVLEPDGSIADFCGNGARVAGCYLNKKYPSPKEIFLQTRMGLLKIYVEQQNYIGVEMPKTCFSKENSKFITNKKEEPFDRVTIETINKNYSFYFSETLEPHLITFDNTVNKELTSLGLYCNNERRDLFPLGININVCIMNADKTLSLTTFERGVNRITKACGTAATSVAQFYSKKHNFLEKILVYVPGGEILVDCSETPIIMWGEAFIGQCG